MAVAIVAFACLIGWIAGKPLMGYAQLLLLPVMIYLESKGRSR